MNRFFDPSSIAVIGASPDPIKGGHSILFNLLQGYRGTIYPVNPKYDKILDLPCYPSISDIPGPVDLAIVFVPARQVPAIVRACAQRGIPGVIVESGGFAETGAEGRALQQQLVDIVRTTGIRIWGPNCMGLVDARRRHVFSFLTPSVWNFGLAPGTVSLIVQSGMLAGGFLIDIMSHGRMGISKALSIGNKADVNETELLEYLIQDPETEAIGMYLESIVDGRRFLELCSSSPKPIAILKGGKSRGGAKAALSHTASMAGDHAVVRSGLLQAGVVEVDDFRQLLDVSRALSMFPNASKASRGRTAILTFSGGAGIVSADFLEANGLELAELSNTTVEALRRIFPEWMPVANPVDLWPAVERNGGQIAYETAMMAVADDPNVDMVLIHLYSGGFALNFDMKRAVDALHRAEKPVFAWLLGDRDHAQRTLQEIQALGVPVLRELQRAADVMKAVVERGRWVSQMGYRRPETDFIELPKHMAGLLGTGRGVLNEYISKQILVEAGIPVVMEQAVNSPEDAVRAAHSFGFPVVVKGLVRNVLHKSEQGLVRMNLRTESEVRSAFEQMAGRIDNQDTIVVQQQIEGRTELIAGVVRDPQFGVCVMAGMGGVWTEVLNDKVFLVAPFDEVQARYMIGRLRSRKVLDGFRGEQPLEVDGFARILVRMGNLALSYPCIQEMDINPFIVKDGKPIAVDANIVLA